MNNVDHDPQAARPYGYRGTIDEAIAQIRAEPEPAIGPQNLMQRLATLSAAQAEKYSAYRIYGGLSVRAALDKAQAT